MRTDARTLDRTENVLNRTERGNFNAKSKVSKMLLIRVTACETTGEEALQDHRNILKRSINHRRGKLLNV